ncbi:MAG TPA: hypothetical protein VFI11_05035, partial [Anaerolineales bacterium]|nr:hypothetical protein [Anaerolineales bacterium]
MAKVAPEVLLFDLDGVLLSSEGYYESLRQTVRHIALSLGFSDVLLSQEDIDLFESLDITAEWDSSALCAALLLHTAWRKNPTLSLPERPLLPRHPVHDLAAPDFQAFALSLADGQGPAHRPLPAALERLLEVEPRTQAQVSLLTRLLSQPRDVESSITFQLVQEFNLGSDLYAEVYGRPGAMGTVSLLATRDRPTLDEGERGRLRQWSRRPGHHMSIVTNRPSRSSASILNTPEAEIGVRAAGMEGFPSISSGALAEAAGLRGLEPQAFLKPNPIHMLAGLRAALGEQAEDAIRAAHALVTNGVVDASWNSLAGAQVSVFEDAPKGMRSARAAAEALSRCGVHIKARLLGVTASPVKAAALEAEGAVL